jgi:Kef-type K+ transport system membrane component KefB
MIDKIASRAKAWPAYFFMLLGVIIALLVIRAAFFGDIAEDKRIWIEVSLLLLVALVAERMVQQWRQPFAMVLLLLGVLVSPYTLNAAWPFFTNALHALGIALPVNAPQFLGGSPVIRAFANIGVILLLFRIGLHSEIGKVFNMRNLLVALGGVLLPFIAGYAYAQWSGGSFAFSLFVGAALTATSVGVTVAVLEEMKAIGRPFAEVILGAAVIDDILALIVLAVIGGMPSGLSGISPEPVARAIGISASFVVSGILLGRFFVERFFNYEEAEISKKTLSGMLAMLFFYSFAAEALGLSAIVGAFIAGLALSYSPLAARLNKALFSMDVVFTPMFFISLGLLVDAPAIPGAIVPVLALTAIAIITKVIGCGGTAALLGMGKKDALLVGWGMVPRGEIALIIALLGATALDASGAPVLGASEYSVIASMAFLSTLVVPWGLAALAKDGKGGN